MAKVNEILSQFPLRGKLLIALIPIAFGVLGGMASEKFRQGQLDSDMNAVKIDVQELKDGKADKANIDYIIQSINELKVDQKEIKADQKVIQTDIKELLKSK